MDPLTIIFKCKDYDGNTEYNSVIGVYDDFDTAKKHLIDKLDKLKYTYEFTIDSDDYCFVTILKKNGKEIVRVAVPCYEISKSKLSVNKLIFK